MWLEWNGISEMKSDTECEGVLGDFFYSEYSENLENSPLFCHNNYSYCDVIK